MSDMCKQEISDSLGDDRDFFEEDFANMVPGSWLPAPKGFDVIVSLVSDAVAVSIYAEDIASSYYGVVPPQQIEARRLSYDRRAARVWDCRD